MADAFVEEARARPLPLGGASRVGLRAVGLVGAVANLLVEARRSESQGPRAFAERAQRTAWRILAGHGVTVEARGPRPAGPTVIVANHLGYLDPLVVSAFVPCLSIAKGETQAWPLVGRGLSALGVLFVRRGDAHSGAVALRRAARALGAGTAVLNFPEGTTSHGHAVGPFRRGVFGLARLAGVPVIPARVSYDDPGVPWVGGETFAPHYARLARTARVTARVHFGEPMALTESDDPAEAADAARAIVASLPVI